MSCYYVGKKSRESLWIYLWKHQAQYSALIKKVKKKKKVWIIKKEIENKTKNIIMAL